MVGTTGFEPTTSSTPRKRATKLRYVPITTTNIIHVYLVFVKPHFQVQWEYKKIAYQEMVCAIIFDATAPTKPNLRQGGEVFACIHMILSASC